MRSVMLQINEYDDDDDDDISAHKVLKMLDSSISAITDVSYTYELLHNEDDDSDNDNDKDVKKRSHFRA